MSRSRGGRLLTTRLPIRTSPLVMSSRPATMRRAVVLPQPDGPTRHMNSPSSMSRFSLLTATAPPAYRFVSSVIRTRATAASSLDRPGENALDEITLKAEEDDQRDDDRDHGPGRDDPVAGGERARLVQEEDRQRVVRAAAQEYQSDEQVVPDPDELEDGKRRNRGQAQREHDPAEELPVAGAVNPSRLQEVPRNAGVEVAHEEDAERQPKRDVEDDDADHVPEYGYPGRVAEHAVEVGHRQQRHLKRNHQKGDHRQQNPVPPRPAAEHQRVSHHAGQAGDQDGGWDGDHHGRDQRVEKRPWLEARGEQGLVVRTRQVRRRRQH